MSEQHPLIQIVDSEDNPLHGGTMDEAQLGGLWHRVARVMIQDSDSGKYLLQMIAPNPYYNGGKWNTTASGHVDQGESYEEAAIRELEEEMGIRTDHLHEIDRYTTEQAKGKRTYRRHNVLYLGRISVDGTTIRPNIEEVERINWVTIDELRTMTRDTPELMTDGLMRFVNQLDGVEV